MNPVRYTQEAVINVWENIAFCKKNNINGAVVAVDMAKAFDCVSHKFLDAVLEFFNFGPIMRQWLKLLGTNRLASIIMDDGKISKFFKLNRGRPQGDVISPTTFNFCVQILIFKLELDNRIERIPIERNFDANEENLTIINDRFNNNTPGIGGQQKIVQKENFFEYKSRGQTSKNEGLADDNTTLCLLKRSCIDALLDNLRDFEKISGLKCNMDKSAIMPVGLTDEDELRSIQTLGIPVVTEIKLLGVCIKKDLDNQGEIFGAILTKITDLASFWDRFRLSLPGRLTIAKTYLLSQLGYIGCFLTPPVEILSQIQETINNFIKGGLNISSTKITDSISNGGLGFFRLDEFLMAQKLSWITRAIKYRIDNWRLDLYMLAPDYDIIRLRKIDIDRERHPILFNLVESLEYFHGQLIKENGNRFLCNIFCTPGIAYDNGNSVITIGTFGRDFYTMHKEIIRRLTYGDFFINERQRTLDDIRENFLPVTVNIWLRIRSAIARTEQLLKKDDNTDSMKISTKDFLTGVSKGSKKVRQVLTRTRTRQELANMRTVTTFCTLVGLPVPEKKVIEMYTKIWGFSFLQNEIREFIFKQRNKFK